jgi:predicted metal-dependent HD superfamily phosphohydrolase
MSLTSLSNENRHSLRMNASNIKSRYWLTLEASHDDVAWDVLDAAYGDLARAYHSWRHIDDLLRAFDELAALAARPELIMTAIFWHDVVYRTRGAGQSRRADFLNVRDSAEMFRRHTRMTSADAEAVHELIMATTNHLEARPSRERYPGFSQDFDLFVDLDLSPLALPWEQFASNFEDIRFEFIWIPEDVFNAGQAAFLKNLLAHGDRLFRLPETIAMWRSAALTNIRRCLNNLSAGDATPAA